MANLKAGTLIGGNLIWDAGNLPLRTTNNDLFIRNVQIYTTEFKPTPADVGALPLLGQADTVASHDTRSSNPLPNAFTKLSGKGVMWEFKSNTTDGFNQGGTYHGVMSFRPYGSNTDGTGGGVHQMGFGQNNKIGVRYGAGGSWGAWDLLYSTNNKPTAADVGAVNKAGDTMTGSLTFDRQTAEIVWGFNTDHAKIGFKNTGDSDTDSYMWFRTGDNNNEYFKWQCVNGSTITDLMTLKTDHLRFKGNAVYHVGYKPNANDVLAVPVKKAHQSDWTSAAHMAGKTYVGGYHSPDAVSSYMSFGAAGTAIMDMFLDGNFYADLGTKKVYHEGFKPTAADVGAPTAIGSWATGSTENITTVSFLNLLKTKGAFDKRYWISRGAWSYAENKTITDTGCGNITLAGCVIEVFGTENNCTIRITAPTTSSNSGSVNSEFIYINNGSGYSPGWRRQYNTRTPPTASEVGAVNKAGDTMTGSLTMGSNKIVGTSTSYHINLAGGNTAPIISMAASVIIAADTDGSGTAEFISLKAGAGTPNELKILSKTSSASVNNSALTFNGNVIYHAGNKPSPSDIGAFNAAGSTATVDGTPGVAWNARSGTYSSRNSGDSDLIAHFYGSGSCPALQIKARYKNGGLWYRSARDGFGFEESWDRIYTAKNKPTATDIGLPKLSDSTEGLRITSNGKFGVFGARNTVWFHMDTDSTNGFYMYKNLEAANLTSRGYVNATGTSSGQGLAFVGRTAIGGTYDDWLRLNPHSQFANGIYCGSTGTIRHDGNIQRGGWGDTGSVIMRPASDIGWGGTTAQSAFGYTQPNTNAAHWLIASYINGINVRCGIQVLSNDTGMMRFYTNKIGNYIDFVNGSITAQNNVSAYSDIRVKDNIEVIENALEKTLKLRGVTYNRTDQDNIRQTGLIAQEVEMVLPEAVMTSVNGDIEDFKSVAYGNLVGLLVESIRELNNKIERLESRIKE